MSSRYARPRGTFDILPEQSHRWRYVEECFIDVAARFGLRRIVTPIFERADLFERSVGDTSDIVEKEMYVFSDRKGRRFALRPEGTAPVVRAYVENNLHLSQGTARLCYSGPMFRYDRPQKGRYRQFYQYGIEVIGSDHPAIDAEVIGVATLLLQELGLTGWRLEINSVGSPATGDAYEQALLDYFSPHEAQLCADCRNRLVKNPRRLLDCKVQGCRDLAVDAPVMLNYLDDDDRAHFAQVQEHLTRMSVPFVVNPRIVRGLDYYTGTAFEIIDDRLGAQSTLIGGGRYNGLVGQLGGKDRPGVGWAGGFERLLLALDEEGIAAGEPLRPVGYIVALGEQAAAVTPSLAHRLRTAGISVEFDPDKTSMKAQMKAADKCAAHVALIVGDDELARGVVALRDLATGEQQNLAEADIIARLKTYKR
ncbi:MAG: histidine--tRNA ligase [Candidatus Cloacimonetes bacterium]|nr:histidine--tRNA ligase [Candidatus Cloacimonadota bacterium]